MRSSAGSSRLDADGLHGQSDLARTGRHRAVGIADLLTAVMAGHTVVHYDAEFDVADEVIDFERRWVAPPGTWRDPPVRQPECRCPD